MIKIPQVAVLQMSPLMGVILLQPFIDLIQVGKVIRYNEDDAFVSFMVSSTRKIEVSTSFNGQRTKIKFRYLVEIYCVSFPALHPCHHIPSEANHHLALIKARSSQYKNYKENGARNIKVYYEIYVTS